MTEPIDPKWMDLAQARAALEHETARRVAVEEAIRAALRSAEWSQTCDCETCQALVKLLEVMEGRA